MIINIIQIKTRIISKLNGQIRGIHITFKNIISNTVSSIWHFPVIVLTIHFMKIIKYNLLFYRMKLTLFVEYFHIKLF